MPSWIGKVIAAIFWSVLGKFRRERQLKDEGRTEGRTETIKGAHNEADARQAEAQAVRDDWDSLDPDERERLRIERGHYRD